MGDTILSLILYCTKSSKLHLSWPRWHIKFHRQSCVNELWKGNWSLFYMHKTPYRLTFYFVSYTWAWFFVSINMVNLFRRQVFPFIFCLIFDKYLRKKLQKQSRLVVCRRRLLYVTAITWNLPTFCNGYLAGYSLKNLLTDKEKKNYAYAVIKIKFQTASINSISSSTYSSTRKGENCRRPRPQILPNK